MCVYSVHRHIFVMKAISFFVAVFVPLTVAQVEMSPMLSSHWEPLTPYPIEVSEAQGAILPGGETVPPELIVLGGAVARSGWRPTLESYALNINNPNGPWRRIKDLPDQLTHQGHAVVGEVLYLCGGYLGRTGHSIADCYGYNHTIDDWFTIPSLPGRRAGGGMVYIERHNSLFFSGGALRPVALIRNETDFSDSWMLDLKNLSKGWVKRADMPNPRNHLSAVGVKGRYFFIGGQREHDEKKGNQHSNQEYIPEEDIWVERARLPIEMGHAMASTNAYLDGFVMVGGSTKGLRLLDHVLYYHIPSDSWHFMTDYPRVAKSLVCGIQDNKLLCAVGQAEKRRRWNDGWGTTLSELKEVVGFM